MKIKTMCKNFMLFNILTVSFVFFLNFTVFASPLVNRIAGQDRYSTSIDISKTGWTTSDYAILATGDDFPDALSATPLAKKYNAPILLTSKYSISAALDSELSRLKVKQVFMLGGSGVISDDVVSQLTTRGITVVRLSGQNRYETSIKIATQLGTSDEIVITTADGFSDALSIASIAASKNIPIILVPKDTIPDSIANFISSKQIYKTYVIGDDSIISDNVAKKFPNSERITAKDKYERNIAILNNFQTSLDFTNIYLATGNDFPDSLSGSALAATKNSPIILVNQYDTSSIKNLLSNKNLSNIVILGGQGAVNSTIVDDIANISSNTTVTQDTLLKTIEVSGTDNISTISTSNRTLQMLASILPANAKDSTVTWSVVNGTGTATINKNGLLTATGNGTVTVVATANDGSLVTGTRDITITNQNSIVIFKSNELKKAVVAVLVGPSNVSLYDFSTPLYQSDLQNITKLDASSCKISDISGIENLPNLTNLDLSGNQLNDISPLKYLKNLQHLSLSNAKVNDITPLKGLTKLTTLTLGDNSISDISPLKGLINLKSLSIFNNNILNAYIIELKAALPHCDINN